MKNVLLTNAYGPYDTAWGEDMLDVLKSRLARGHDGLALSSELPAWGLHLIAENVRNPCTVIEHPHWDDFMREVEKGYGVIGIQLKSVHTDRVVRMVRAIRELSPKTEIVLGGYGVSALNDPMPGDTEGHADFLKESAHHLCHEEGVRFMRRLLGDTPADRPITQFDLPCARYHSPGIRGFAFRIPAILVALGCPGACEFCNTSAFFKHRKIYIADPEETYAFMKRHHERLGGDMLYTTLFDEDLFRSPEYVRELGRLIRSDRKTWGFRWITFGSVKALSAFEPEELRECGLGSVWIGVESGFTEDGRSKTGYAKREGGKTPPQIFEELQRYGIETIASMILGFDFHTPDNIIEDIDYFVKLKPLFYQVAPLTPCPGTKLYRQLYKQGRILPHFSFRDFHIWKDEVFAMKNFKPGDMRKYYDLAHEKMRTVNGPPTLQFAEMNISAYETMKDSGSPFLRHQADTARTLALGALPLVRSVANHPPSPEVRARARDIAARGRRVLGRGSIPVRVIGRVIGEYTDWRLRNADPLDQPPVVSDPPMRRATYHQPGGKSGRRAGSAGLLRRFARENAGGGPGRGLRR